MDHIIPSIKYFVGGPSDFGIGWILLLLAAVIAIVSASSQISFLIWKRWTEKARHLQIISQLDTAAHITYFTGLLGNPVSIAEVDDVAEYLYVTKYCFVVAQTDPNGRVLLFSVTTRRSNFKPLLLGREGVEFVVLGTSTFRSQPSHQPQERYITWDHGAPIGYGEAHYFGYEGGYRMYFFAFNWKGFGKLHVKGMPALEGEAAEFPVDEDLVFDGTTINTYVVSARHSLGADRKWPTNTPFGPASIPGTLGGLW